MTGIFAPSGPKAPSGAGGDARVLKRPSAGPPNPSECPERGFPASVTKFAGVNGNRNNLTANPEFSELEFIESEVSKKWFRGSGFCPNVIAGIDGTER